MLAKLARGQLSIAQSDWVKTDVADKKIVQMCETVYIEVLQRTSRI